MNATSAPPANNPLLVLLDFVASPLLLFNAEGQVVHANSAAKTMGSRPALLLGSDPHVRARVRDLTAGKIVVDTEMRVEALSDDGVARLVCRFAPRPIAGLVAASVSAAETETPDEPPPEASPADQRMSLQQIMALLKGDLVPHIQTVLAQSESRSPLSPALEQLRERLERTVDLVNVFGDDVLVGEERMIIPDLVRDICQELSPLAATRKVSFGNPPETHRAEK